MAWRTPPRHYGPWELFASLLTEGLVALGHDVTLFATADSVTTGRLRGTSPPGGPRTRPIEPKVAECLHLADVFEHAAEFDVIHNGFDFLPLTYSGLVDTPVVTTIHGFSSPRIVPVYERYDATTTYVAISDADRHPRLHYAATIHHGIDVDAFAVDPAPADHLLFFGRIHPDKGTAEAIAVAAAAGRRLVIAGIVQDERYFRDEVEPHVDGDRVRYVGPVGARRAVGRARRCPRPAPPHRLRRAVRLQRRRGDGLRDAGHRPRPRVDGRAHHRRAHRVPRRRRRRGGAGGRPPPGRSTAAAIRSATVGRFDRSTMVAKYVAVYRDVLAARRLGRRG